MSGGEWDYFYLRCEEVAERLSEDEVEARRDFGGLMSKVAKAMHDIEWVDSGDTSPGDELNAINEVIRYQHTLREHDSNTGENL